MGYLLELDVTEAAILLQISFNSIANIYSSAYHHSSNPAERAVCTVKGLMKCCVSAKQSWRLALLEYLSTSLDAKTPSPSELNGRKFGSMLPNISNFSTHHSDRLVERHTAQL